VATLLAVGRQPARRASSRTGQGASIHVPTVSIGLPVFNGERYLAEALESLRAQDFDDFELLIGDNGSTDRTRDICLNYARRDSRITYHRSDVNRGATWNYNRLVPLACGRYFKWAAHDDVCAPTFLRRCVEALQSVDEHTVLCYPRTVLIDEHGGVLDDQFLDGLDLDEGSPHERLARHARHTGEQHAVFGLLRMSALRRTGLIRGFWGGDLALLSELLLLGRFIELPDRLFYRRYHPGTSLVATRSFEEATAWFDPRRHGRASLPRVELLLDLLRTVARAPLPPSERARCAASLLGNWVPTYWRQMGGEMKRAAKYRVRARCAGATPGSIGSALPAGTDAGGDGPAEG
jgi:glycosyltransferase involved in cell wall biosynthesis